MSRTLALLLLAGCLFVPQTFEPTVCSSTYNASLALPKSMSV
jgi:hypothetical protein